jgi:hypothetical protein
VYALCSSMALIDFMTEPVFECVDDDYGDLAFICATEPSHSWPASASEESPKERPRYQR